MCIHVLGVVQQKWSIFGIQLRCLRCLNQIYMSENCQKLASRRPCLTPKKIAQEPSLLPNEPHPSFHDDPWLSASNLPWTTSNASILPQLCMVKWHIYAWRALSTWRERQTWLLDWMVCIAITGVCKKTTSTQTRWWIPSQQADQPGIFATVGHDGVHFSSSL